MTPILEIKNLSTYFPMERSLWDQVVLRRPPLIVRAVDGVDLHIRRGEVLSLVGESGSGKSTLGRTLVQLVRPNSGEVLFEGCPIDMRTRAARDSFRHQVQMVFQNPYSSLNPRKRVDQILGVALARAGVPAASRRDQAARLLQQVGMTAEYLDSYPHQMSGGQRQRVAIARALAMKPSLIVADEPVSALDVSVQAQILKLLQDLQRQMNLTYLFITHDLSVVYHLSNRVAVMYLGRVVELADTDPLFVDPLHPYTEALLSAAPSIDRPEGAERIILQGGIPSPLSPPDGCQFHPRCPKMAGDVCRTVRPRLREATPGRFVACHLHNSPETVD